MSEAAIFTEGLSKSFGAQVAVAELNLKIQPGACTDSWAQRRGENNDDADAVGLVRPTKGSARVLGSIRQKRRS